MASQKRKIVLLNAIIEYHHTLKHDHLVLKCNCGVTIEFNRWVLNG